MLFLDWERVVGRRVGDAAADAVDDGVGDGGSSSFLSDDEPNMLNIDERVAGCVARRHVGMDRKWGRWKLCERYATALEEIR